MLDIIGNSYPYWVIIFLVMVGLYITMAYGNMIKKMIGLNIFQTGALLLFIVIGNKHHATAPLLSLSSDSFVNPLPHVLVLTAIVVGFATTLMGLALALRADRQWGTTDEDTITASLKKNGK